MIIVCVNCNKKFEVDSNLIPKEGRKIQCGACDHVWFFKNEIDNPIYLTDDEKPKKISKINKKNNLKKDHKIIKQNPIKEIKKKSYELTKYNTKSNFSLGKFLSYILVLSISFIAIIIILDTFKSPLNNIFPNLELVLFNLYETLIDIKLFVKDLLKQ
tara:strand:- start:266 stop:739 length:474 start_codon:yes stop_codon:yes gene_type:complete